MLITGGAGFIGSNLVRACLAQGRPVTVLDNFSTGFRENLSDIQDQIQLIEGSIEDLATVQQAVQGQPEVIHLAALGSVPRSLKDPLATHAVNATGFLNVLAACGAAGVRRLVYASSSSVYGDSPTLPKREAETGQVLSPYAATKAINEHYARTLAPVYGLSAIGLRFFNVFGPRQSPAGAYAAVIPKFIDAATKAEPLQIYGDGLQSRDFTYVSNVIEAILQAVDAPLLEGQAQVCNIGCGETISLNEIAQAIVDGTGSSSAIVHVAPRPGDIRHSLADIAHARRILGYQPQVSVRTGLQQTIAWFKSIPS